MDVQSKISKYEKVINLKGKDKIQYLLEYNHTLPCPVGITEINIVLSIRRYRVRNEFLFMDLREKNNSL